MERRVVILADGTYPSSERTLKILRNADLLICCDGAAEKAISRGVIPDFIAGDMDSMPIELQRQYSDIIRKSDNQDTNDLTKAVDLAKSFNPAQVTILGATGRREDHTLGNISLLAEYAQECPFPVDMVTDHGRFFTINDSTVFDAVPGMAISFFTFDQSLRIKSTGLEYPLDEVIFDSLWKASLNIVSESKVSLEFSHPAIVLIFETE